MRKRLNAIYIIILAGLVMIIYACACSTSSKTQTRNMSTRQTMLKAFYPVLTKVTRFFGVNNRKIISTTAEQPHTSIYEIPIVLNSGDTITLSQWRGKKILIVNTASDCGYTGQYEELQSLYDQQKGKIMIIGFPANDFKKQEKATDQDIAAFCKKNYGVSFPIAMKASVIKGNDQHPLYKWLSTADQNGWNTEAPAWNFSKYIIDEQGKLSSYFDPGVSPVGDDILNELTKSL